MFGTGRYQANFTCDANFLNYVHLEFPVEVYLRKTFFLYVRYSWALIQKLVLTIFFH